MSSRKKMVFFRCWAFMIPAIFFSIVTDTLHMTVLGCFFSLVALSMNQPLKITTRSVVYSLVIAFTLVTIFNAFMKVENRFYLTPSEIGIPTMLVLAMVITLFSNKPTITSIVLILSIFAIMMNGDITEGHEFASLPLPQGFGELKNIKILYIVALISCLPPFYFLMNRSQNRLKISKLPAFKWQFLKYFIIILGLILTGIMYIPTFSTIVPISRKAESSIIQWVSQFRVNRNTRAFEQKISLKNSFLMKNLGLDEVLIRVQSDEMPGYLRSRSYEFYHAGGWASEIKPSNMPLLNEDHEYTHSTFSFQGAPRPEKTSLQKMDIYYSSNFKVNTILHRGTSNYIELKCDGLDQTPDATVSGKAVDFSGGLTIYNKPGSKVNDAYPGPEISEDNLLTYLQVPNPKMHTDLLERFKHIKSNNPNQVAKEIVKYFPENGFTYSLNSKLKKEMDPVFSFLENKKGHCELYATTSVMVLRSKGIPARYVTGFYCQEQHPSGNYFVGRSMDLHAWVEYYDEEDQVWKHMEPTPPAYLPQGIPKFNSASALWDNLANRWQELISNIVRGFFAESVILLLKSFFNFLLWFINTPIKAIITIAALLAILRWQRRKRNESDFDQELLEISKQFKKILQKINKIEGFESSPSTTVRDIVKFLENRKDNISLNYASCLKEYELVRYDKNRRSPENIKEIQTKLKALLKTRIG